jgi:hypothetical protein
MAVISQSSERLPAGKGESGVSPPGHSLTNNTNRIGTTSTNERWWIKISTAEKTTMSSVKWLAVDRREAATANKKKKKKVNQSVWGKK